MSHLNRRNLIGLGAAGAFSALSPRLASAAGSRDFRLVTIVLRGALDGLSAVPPVGDPDYESLRGALALPVAGEGAALRLDDMFGLHPALSGFHDLYTQGEAMVVHASATGYRERSHFDGQDVLESGYTVPGHTDSGWMNRLASALPQPHYAEGHERAVAIGAITPLTLRGPAPVLGWAPPQLKAVDPDLTGRLMDLYAESDPALARSLKEGIETGRIASAMTLKASGGGPADPAVMKTMAEGAARLLAQDSGPRLCAMAFEGWDTHAGEVQRLAKLLGGLDQAITALKTGLGPGWRDTVLVVMTEFGRTAHGNGTQGTDHGTAAAAFLAGGALKGGRVLSDWPGLKEKDLYEGRDLKPTTDIRAVLKGLASDMFAQTESGLAGTIFPDSVDVRAQRDLLA